MPTLHFEPSEPLTLGIEEEFTLVDAADGITAVDRADELLDGAWHSIATPGGWIKPELLRSSIEVATAASANLAQVDVDLRALRDVVVARATRAGVHACGIGMHPTLVAHRAMVTPTAAHQAIADLHERVGTLGEQVTHGIHVHVGMPSLADAVRVTEALAGCVPLLVACTVNSPIVAGRRSPWHSARSDVLRRMLWAGTTPRFASVDDYVAVHAQHQLENSGQQRFLWDVAPVPALGTVEVRVIDAAPDARVALAIAALVQAIAAYVLDGGELPRMHGSLERHNRWSAMEFGARARFLVPGGSEPVNVGQLLHALVDQVRDAARALGSESWLAPIDELLANSGANAAIEAFGTGGAAAVLELARVRASEDEPHDEDSVSDAAADHAGT